MTKIIVPVSGGVDSAALLHRTLVDTQDDVVAIRVREDLYFPGPPGWSEAEAESFLAVCNWLAGNVREFDYYTVEPTRSHPNGTAYDRTEKVPVRPGYARTYGPYWARCRYGSIGRAAREAKATEVRWGLNTWNSRFGPNHWKIHIDSFREWSELPFVAPWIERDMTTGRCTGRSKLRNFHALPKELLDLVAASHSPLPEAAAARTALRFYNEICASNLDRLDAIELRCERAGFFGRHYADADPETYTRMELYDSLRDIPGWKRWLAASS